MFYWIKCSFHQNSIGLLRSLAFQTYVFLSSRWTVNCYPTKYYELFNYLRLVYSSCRRSFMSRVSLLNDSFSSLQACWTKYKILTIDNFGRITQYLKKRESQNKTIQYTVVGLLKHHKVWLTSKNLFSN